MAKIVRTPTRAEGGITAEEKAKMDELSALWISRAMRTAPIEPDRIIPAIERLYAVSGLAKPRVIIVPSPLVMAIAGVASACVLKFRELRAATYAATIDATIDATVVATRAATRDATRDATDAATRAATFAATRDATCAATFDATYAATFAATRAATDAATRDATVAATFAVTSDATYAATRAATDAATSDATDAATRDATRAATFAATFDATHAATSDATSDATRDATRDATVAAPFSWVWDFAQAVTGNELLAKAIISALPRWWNMYQGGNMWAGWESYLVAGRDILGLRLEAHKKYEAWEECAIHGGFRIMHGDFCMVSDFPEILLKDSQNRPHCDDGPSHRWRDGWSLYHVHGVRLDGWIVEHPELITVAKIDAEPNAEIRRVMVERYGAGRYLLDSGAKEVSRDSCGVLYTKDQPEDEPLVMVRVLNSTPEQDGTLTRDEALAQFHADTPIVDDDHNIPLSSADPDLRFKAYMIRVPPNMLTARQAVAWTFGVAAEDYEPVFES